MSTEVTRLLHEMGQGDATAVDRLLPLVYEELHALARRMMSAERAGHTLQPTALVHEAYLRLVDAESGYANRGHFVGIAARAMRQILVNHAIARNAQKRGGGASTVPLNGTIEAFEARAFDLIALDEALKKLAELDPEQCQIVECRFFAGLSMAEIAEVVGKPLRTVEREWNLARAWLRQQMHVETIDDRPS